MKNEKYCISVKNADGSENVVASGLSDKEMLQFLIENCAGEDGQLLVCKEGA